MTQRTVTTLRLPADVKAFLEAEALENGSSQNSEIVRAIRAQMRLSSRDSAMRFEANGHSGGGHAID